MARANGAFPDEFSIHFPSNAPHRILLGANFGMLVSEDDGATWRYACEPWVVAGSNAALASANVGFYQVTADGSAILADSVNLTRSSDVACTWPISSGSIAGQVVTDIWADPIDANRVYAIIAASSGSYVVASRDGGVTFDSAPLLDLRPPAGQTGAGDILDTIESARTKPGTVYATSNPISYNASAGKVAKLWMSTDSGATWSSTVLTADVGTEPRILAVDPANEKIVYLRLTNGIQDRLWITMDGGATFIQDVLSISGLFSSFLRAADGALYLGTRDGKLYVRPAGAPSFEATARNAPHLRCLGQRFGSASPRFYGCADQVLDGYSVGYSDDNGASFHPLMSFTQILGPLTCAPVTDNCQAHWERIQGVLGIGDGGTASDGGGGGGSGGGGGGGGKSCASLSPDFLGLGVALAFWMRRKGRGT